MGMQELAVGVCAVLLCHPVVSRAYMLIRAAAGQLWPLLQSFWLQRSYHPKGVVK